METEKIKWSELDNQHKIEVLKKEVIHLIKLQERILDWIKGKDGEIDFYFCDGTERVAKRVKDFTNEPYIL